MGNISQLCWECARCLPGRGCSWADNLKPVKGWTASRTYILGCKKMLRTYVIIKCPLFISDADYRKQQELKAVIKRENRRSKAKS